MLNSTSQEQDGLIDEGCTSLAACGNGIWPPFLTLPWPPSLGHGVHFGAGSAKITHSFPSVECDQVWVLWGHRMGAAPVALSPPVLSLFCSLRDKETVLMLPTFFPLLPAWNDGKIRAFAPETGRLMYAINSAHRIGVTAIATTSDCHRIISGGGEGEVLFLRAEFYKIIMIAIILHFEQVHQMRPAP